MRFPCQKKKYMFIKNNAFTLNSHLTLFTLVDASLTISTSQCQSSLICDCQEAEQTVPSHPPGLSRLAETETPVMAAGRVNHQQAVGNGGRPAPNHPIPGNMWTEGLSTADRPQKKKKSNHTVVRATIAVCSAYLKVFGVLSLVI